MRVRGRRDATPRRATRRRAVLVQEPFLWARVVSCTYYWRFFTDRHLLVASLPRARRRPPHRAHRVREPLHPLLFTSSRCATWTSRACCGTTATARPARVRLRKRQKTSPPRGWTKMRPPGKTRARPRRRETRTSRCALSHVSRDIARAPAFARREPVPVPRATAPPRPPRPSLATVRLPPFVFCFLTRNKRSADD